MAKTEQKLAPMEYVGRRHLTREGLSSAGVTEYVISVQHPNGPWEAIACRTEEQAKVVVQACNVHDDLVLRARAAEQVMFNGFICPEDQGGEFERGWYSACKAMKESEARAQLNMLLAEIGPTTRALQAPAAAVEGLESGEQENPR